MWSPNMKVVLINYRDVEGDLVTITTTDELRLAEASGDQQGSFTFYIVDVSLDKDPLHEELEIIISSSGNVYENGYAGKYRETEKGTNCIHDWIFQFPRLFKNRVGFDSDSYMDLHELGMELYPEAMEDTVSGEDAQELFEIAGGKFQEMVALAFFNWGNAHMSRGRKRVLLTEDGSRETVLTQVKNAFEWAKKEYVKAGKRHEEAVKIKPDFYDGLLALGGQQSRDPRVILTKPKIAWKGVCRCGRRLKDGVLMDFPNRRNTKPICRKWVWTGYLKMCLPKKLQCWLQIWILFGLGLGLGFE
ncbi:hypothetical protein Vadar_002411 [Vaccinium darrowii]|uniref:Uncharacterized protein n=1 Tax=Vaccinium darrowii TaxID=229202 RepID=A0ACB7XEU4_9ERIC|nr:hypothetical protein Vadar_002411 [Vaccinium darrowii]